MPEDIFSLNNPNFLGIMLRFGINLIFLFILNWFVYYRYNKKERFLFTFFLMGIMVFFICSMLGTVLLDISFAFGLFAIFAILRFRTRNFSVKDMSYTFVSIGISMINSLKVFKFPLVGILIFNIIIILSAFVLEEFLSRNKTGSHSISYENLDLLKPGKEQKLMKDIGELTGKEIIRVKIQSVNYKRKIAFLDIVYKG
jgi:hypothetical protein